MIRECLTGNHTVHATNRISLGICCIVIAAFCVVADSSVQAAEKNLPIKGEVFTIKDRTAFLILPQKSKSGDPIPWLWYAPTLRGLPGKAEKWMFDKFLENGIAIAGVDVGESYGSPKGRDVYSALYKELVEKRGLTKQASLLARSRGGLMLYNWAVENPKSVACIAGIYPVCNLSSYPGLARACGAYEMNEDQLAAKLTEHNPIDRLAPLAKAKVPIFHIHGDSDTVVPLDKNSSELKKRYEELGGKMTLEIVRGQGHNMWSGWFQSQELVDFVITHARENKPKVTVQAFSGLPEKIIDWSAFMQQHDMTFDKLPDGWTEAPHFGNAMLGSMLYQADDTIRLQVFRADVHDHRDDTYGWPAYSRPRLMIGHFSLHPVGKLNGCSWQKDLWNAELTGTIQTDKGEIQIRHFTHAEDMAIVTELTPSAGEQGCRWTWHPAEARTTRGGYPTNAAEINEFADRYGSHYTKTLKLFKANPAGRQETQENVSVWIQDLLAGGQYATAWGEQVKKQTRTHIVSIANSYPESTAAETAVLDVKRFLKLDSTNWTKAHRNWWHNYYTRSFITIPDKGLESLYWQTIYRFGCTSRTGRCYVDTSGIWFQGGPWAYTTTDWNIQCGHWPVYAANRLEQGAELLNRFHENRDELVKAVRPVQWQKDSAYLPIEVAGDLIGNREQDKRYIHLVGTLPWTMNNFWSQYRYSMDDQMLREKIYPMLRRSINMYFYMVETDDDGKLHLPPTYSPETGVWKDANFDLALFKWGCYTLLKASKRLGIDDPLIPQWKKVTEKLVDFPEDENGFRLGSEKSSPDKHRHFSNLLMIYPLFLVNIEQEGTMDVLQRSYDRAHATGGLQAMVQSHAGPIGAALGQGDTVLEGLKRLQDDLYPNGLWFRNPCIESSLGMANIIQDMLIQSWTDPAADESGPIRIFPATPSEWKDIEFRNLRTEGAFLVSAKRKDGQTEWVRIKSLAGEPCRVRPGIDGKIRIKGKRKHKLKQASPGIYEIDMKKGDEVLLY